MFMCTVQVVLLRRRGYRCHSFFSIYKLKLNSYYIFQPIGFWLSKRSQCTNSRAAMWNRHLEKPIALLNCVHTEISRGQQWLRCALRAPYSIRARNVYFVIVQWLRSRPNHDTRCYQYAALAYPPAGPVWFWCRPPAGRVLHVWHLCFGKQLL